MTLEEVYERLLAALRESSTPFAFIGALGAIAWGRPRATTDLDLVVLCDTARFKMLRDALVAKGLTEGAGVEVPIAKPEAMLVYKLLASRPKDLIDVDAILEGRALAGQAIDWELTRRWASVWGIEDKVDALRGRRR